jgi:hypothetical protein
LLAPAVQNEIARFLVKRYREIGRLVLDDADLKRTMYRLAVAEHRLSAAGLAEEFGRAEGELGEMEDRGSKFERLLEIAEAMLKEAGRFEEFERAFDEIWPR